MKKFAHLDELRSAFERRGGRIRRRLAEYRRVSPEKYFYELIYCLMTPQSSAVNAGLAQKKFEEMRFFEHDADPERVLGSRDHYIRFHKTKAKRIMEMKAGFSEISDIVQSALPATEKREWLVRSVKGLSYKEATHFLRNIGKNEGLTILDRHILKNLKYHSVIGSLPKTVTKKKYLAIEKKFLRFAQEIGISVDELDLLFWSNETGEILK